MSYEVKLQTFSGPLQLLLDLIEREELPITDVSLAKVTDDYLNYLNDHDVATEELADFLVVASRLLLIKSHAILPRLELPDDDGPALADQLRLYRLFVDAAKRIEERWNAGTVGFPHEPVRQLYEPRFTPPVGVVPSVLREAFGSLQKRLQPFFAIQEASLRRVVSVQERIRQIEDMIAERAHSMFREIVTGADRPHVIVSFLALLELVKRRVVKVVQGGAFEDISIKRVD